MRFLNYRKKPVVIQAGQLLHSTALAIAEWCGGTWVNLVGRGDHGGDISHIRIETLEGTMRADLGDWIIKEPHPTEDRKFYPCKHDIFMATYDLCVVDEAVREFNS